jgi:hypothetical protein
VRGLPAPIRGGLRPSAVSRELSPFRDEMISISIVPYAFSEVSSLGGDGDRALGLAAQPSSRQATERPVGACETVLRRPLRESQAGRQNSQGAL